MFNGIVYNQGLIKSIKKNTKYVTGSLVVEITSDKGHDSFLLDVPDFLNAVKNFLNTSYSKFYEKRI